MKQGWIGTTANGEHYGFYTEIGIADYDALDYARTVINSEIVEVKAYRIEYQYNYCLLYTSVSSTSKNHFRPPYTLHITKDLANIYSGSLLLLPVTPTKHTT